MNRTVIRTLTQAMMRASWLVVALVGVAAAQSDFSAVVVDNQRPDAGAKIYISKDKIRFESGKKDPRNSGAMIMNMATQSALVVMDQQHMYMEIPMQMASQRQAYNFFRAGDVENACSSWLNSGKNNGGNCHKVGADTVNGRAVIKYEGTNAKGDSGFFWIDPKIAFPVKWENKSGGGELRDIQEGSQPSSLFEVPSGYTKMDVGGMMQRPQ